MSLLKKYKSALIYSPTFLEAIFSGVQKENLKEQLDICFLTYFPWDFSSLM